MTYILSIFKFLNPVILKNYTQRLHEVIIRNITVWIKFPTANLRQFQWNSKKKRLPSIHKETNIKKLSNS